MILPFELYNHGLFRNFSVRDLIRDKIFSLVVGFKDNFPTSEICEDNFPDSEICFANFLFGSDLGKPAG